MATTAPVKKRAKKGKKGRKIDRNRSWCQAYRARGQREKNKLKRVIKHFATHPGDNVAKHLIANGGRRSGGL